MGGDRKRERGLATFGDVLSSEMTSKLIELRTQLATKAVEPRKEQAKVNASSVKRPTVIVEVKRRKKFTGSDALKGNKRFPIFPDPIRKLERNNLVKPNVTKSNLKVDDHRPESKWGFLEAKANRREPLAATVRHLSPIISETNFPPNINTHDSHSSDTKNVGPFPVYNAETEGCMFDLCLFDLDDTLVRTGDMENIRLEGKNINTDAYKASVREIYHAEKNRNIYEAGLLYLMQKKFPNLKLGVFTRAPKAYARTVLNEAFDGVRWDVVVAYEDVMRTKPYGDGIFRAMTATGVKHPNRVLMVGDGDIDIRSAYNAGVVAALDKSSWLPRYRSDNWNALNHMPDMIFDNPSAVLSALGSLQKFQPELERTLSGDKEAPVDPRFDRVGKFIHRHAGGDNTSYQIYACGRYFSNYKSLSERRKWHALSRSIHVNKDSDVFPEEWIYSVRTFVRKYFRSLKSGAPLLVTVIPHRPGRAPRLERFLTQLQQSLERDPFLGSEQIFFAPELLAYRKGVRSHNKEHLGAAERFINVRDHLYVNNPEALVDNKPVLIIDDVCTTGASLIYAGKHLVDAGSGEVTRLSIAMTISDVL